MQFSFGCHCGSSGSRSRTLLFRDVPYGAPAGLRVDRSPSGLRRHTRSQAQPLRSSAGRLSAIGLELASVADWSDLHTDEARADSVEGGELREQLIVNSQTVTSQK